MTKKERLIQRGIDPRLYAAWDNMKARCKRHPAYAGRGIMMDPRWQMFANFAADMGPHPGTGYSLDRKKNHEGYRRGNCRWTTPGVQANNRRDAVNRKLTKTDYHRIVREPGTLRQLAGKYGVCFQMIAKIKKQGIGL